SERYVRWRDLVVIACIVTVGSVFALFLSTAVFPDGPLLTQAKLGAIATLAGVPITAAAARALRVGRFAGGAGVCRGTGRCSGCSSPSRGRTGRRSSSCSRP